MLFALRNLMRIKFSRCFTLTSNRMQKCQSSKPGPVPEKLKRAQKLFQEKNNLPVFLKGGKNDKILYYTTCGLAGLGLLCDFGLYAGYIID